MRRRALNAGYSLVELLIVSGIVIIMSAIAVPSVVRSVRTYELSGTVSQVSQMLLRTRQEAIRLNRNNPPLACRLQAVGNTSLIYIDLDNDSTPDAVEPQYLLPESVQFLPAGTAPSSVSMGFAATSTPAGAIAFDARGMVDYGVSPPSVLVMFMGVPGQPDKGFRALSLTPFGRMQVWNAEENGVWHKR